MPLFRSFVVSLAVVLLGCSGSSDGSGREAPPEDALWQEATGDGGVPDAGTTDAGVPDAGDGLAGLTRIATAEYQLFYLVDGQVLGLGSNRAGQLGVGHANPYNQVPPTRIALPETLRFKDVAGGGFQSLALDVQGRVWTFGQNLYGQRGDGTTNDQPNRATTPNNGQPYLVLTDSTGATFDNVVAVRSALLFNMALKADGSVWVWGMSGTAIGNTLGIAGDGNTAPRNITRPTRVPLPQGVRITTFTTNDSTLFALDDTGKVWAWGGGSAAETLGTGRFNDYARPNSLNIPVKVKEVAAGGSRWAVALDENGALWGWGIQGTFLGLGAPTGQWYPVATPVKLSFPEFGSRKIAHVSANGHATHVILDDGSLWGWGDSAMGEVGNGVMLDFATYPTPYQWDWSNYQKMVFRPVRIAPGVTFKALHNTAQSFYGYATATDGTIYSWGRNKTGVLGNGVLPTGDVANRPDSWNVATATAVPAHELTSAVPTPSK
ncbi:RCC1 domain-containing protein [Pyxidicoccus sp. 3LG]